MILESPTETVCGKLVDLFCRVLLRNPSTIEMIEGYEGELCLLNDERKLCVFSLAGIYDFLNLSETMEFSEFRKCLYNSSVNQILAGYGGKVEIHKSTGKVESNLYALISV